MRTRSFPSFRIKIKFESLFIQSLRYRNFLTILPFYILSNVIQAQMPNKVSVRFAEGVSIPTSLSLAPQELKDIYSYYDVTDFEQLYPSAALIDHPLAEGLLRVYELTCDCNEANRR